MAPALAMDILVGMVVIASKLAMAEVACSTNMLARPTQLDTAMERHVVIAKLFVFTLTALRIAKEKLRLTNRSVQYLLDAI